MVQAKQESRSKIASAAASLYLSNVLTLLINTAFIVFSTNILPLSEFGRFALINIVIIFAATLSVFALPVTGGSIIGTPPALTRFLPDFRLYPSSARRLIITFSLISFFVSLMLSLLFLSRPLYSLLYNGEPYLAVTASIDFVAYSLAQVSSYSLIGIGKATLSSKAMIISNALRYFLAIVAIFTGLGVAGIFLGFSIGDITLGAFGLAVSLSNSTGFESKKIDLRKVFSYTLSIFLISIVGIAVSQFDKLIAYLGRGIETLGIYNVAVVGASIVSFAPSAILNALVSYIPVYSKSEIPGLIKAYTKYVSLTALPVGFILASLSPYLLRIFGDQYSSGSLVMAVISVSFALTSISSVYASGLLINDTSHFYALSNIIGLIILFIVSYLLIPFVGINGVAIGRATMIFASSVLIYIFARRANYAQSDWRTYAYCLISSILSALIILLASSLLFSFIVSRIFVIFLSFALALVGAFVYLLELKILRVVKEEDIEFIKRVLPERFAWLSRLFVWLTA